ncbi:MAG: hypothetical protein ABIJ21_06065 [Nanoarchaeota archaeon]
MKCRQFGILFLFLSILLVGTSATEFKITQLNTSIFKDGVATYQISIINDADYVDRFQVFSHSARFIIQIDPKPESFNIDAGSFESFIITVTPKDVVGIGPYAVPVKVKSLVTDTLYAVSLPINIKDSNLPEGVYPPNPSLTLTFPPKIDPREKLRININLRNRNPRDLDEVAVVIESSLFQKTYTTTLLGMEEKGNELIFDLDPFQKPGIYAITAKLIFENKSYAEEVKNFEILRYSNPEEIPTVTKELFKTTTAYSFINNGNDADTIEKNVNSNFFRNLFITTEPKATKVKGDLTWSFSLMPKEAYTVTVVENYRVPIIILLVIIVIVALYFILRSPIICYKDVHLHPSKEGVSDIKVKLLIKNRTANKIGSIKIIDRIPAIAEFVKTDNLGTMSPTKIIHDSKKGVIVRYDLHQLDPYEERIITYNIKSKLKIVGGLSLGPAKVKFDSGKGTERKTYSNEVDIKTRHQGA